MRRLRYLFVTLFVLLFTIFSGAVQAGSKEGAFILFLGGAEVGREEYSLTSEEFRMQGVISVGAQSLEVVTVLRGSQGKWAEGEVTLKPGATVKVTFKPGKVEAETGPIRKSYDLVEPFVVLENNAFSHFEQILRLLPADAQEMAFAGVMPSLVLANQSPILDSSVVRLGQAGYEIEGRRLLLDEYILTIAGGLQMRLLADGDTLIKLEIPLQAAEVFREGYVGLQQAVQEPAGPAHFRTEEFKVPNGDVTLAGTLFLPLGEGPFPAVLLNSGSGPQDRQGNSPPSLMTNMFSILADRLTEVGIAVLCYDERGVGESTGDYDAADLHDLLSDVEALLDFLKTHPEVDAERLAMLGHSEGGYFAPIFAGRLSAIVLLAAPSATLDHIMVEQVDFQMGLPGLPEETKAVLAEYNVQVQLLIEEAREGKEVSSGLPTNLDWVRQHMELRPLETAAEVKCPVLIVQGEEDYQVLPYHAEALAERMREAGNDRVTVKLLPETTHLFTYAGTSSQFDQLNPFRLNPELVDTVVAWLAENL